MYLKTVLINDYSPLVMSLTLYNTLTRRKEPFTSLKSGRVTIYCCGVTVYDDCHLGHARSYIGWDVVRRYLWWRGYQVRYVQNFTDIDDKILNRAKSEGSTMQEVSDRYIAAYFRDIRRLNILDADEYPRVTEHIPAIHPLIQALENQGYAYAVDGDVYYNVRQFAGYGKLSGRQLEQMQAGAGGRVDPDDLEQKKQDSCDFALWRAAKPGEPAWNSPWGKGRPGWHIECSAMIRVRLGETIVTDFIADAHSTGSSLWLASKQRNLFCKKNDAVWVESLLQQRQQARQEKRYVESDRIRNELQAAGIILVDQPNGQTQWHQ